MQTLWIGARGPAVSELQSRLRQLGYDVGEIDAVFGPRTQQAVAAFQQDHGLVVDGFVGPKTLAALELQHVPVRPKASKRSKVFISYSHADAKWLEQLQVHLAPLERNGLIERWDDELIAPGDRWRQEISKGLAQARVAILLVSPTFMASEFIQSQELPALLSAAQRDGLSILPVIISPCLMGGLAEFQAVNPPNRPLVDLSRGDRDRVWVRVAECVTTAMND